MADIKFCPHCGEKRVAQSQFCVACGQGFAGSGKHHLTYVLVAGAALVVLVFAVIRYGIMKPTAPPVAPTEVAHEHNEPPALVQLRQLAINGDVSALMDLAEAEIQQAGQDRHYLAMASETLERVLISYPKHAYVLRLLGHLYYDQQESERSIQYYNRYLELHPEDANVLTDLGTQYLATDRPQQALAAYQAALDVFPNFYNALFNMHKAYETMGDTAKAQEYGEKAQQAEAKFGKQLAPDVVLPRLPEGAPSSDHDHVASGPEASLVSNGVDYAPVKAFFGAHPIIGPKMASFRVENGKGILAMDQFPMDRMPPMMKEQLSNKISTMLQALDPKAVVEMQDAANGKVMASYSGQAH